MNGHGVNLVQSFVCTLSKDQCMLYFFASAHLEVQSHINPKSVWHICFSSHRRSNLRSWWFSHVLSGQFHIPELRNVDITFGSERVILGKGQNKIRHQALDDKA